MQKVLIAEDDDDLRSVLADVLEYEGYAVEVAQDGQFAIDRLLEAPRPDLLILDIRMPRKSGYDVLEMIRQTPALRELPVIVLTAETARIPAGPVAWLSKPVFPSLLLAVVANYLRPARELKSE